LLLIALARTVCILLLFLFWPASLFLTSLFCSFRKPVEQRV
jgi:hypothetical protein